MTVSLSNKLSISPKTYALKRKLNKEFLEKGRILDAVSILYYPVQYGPSPHGELSIEGSCYYFRNGNGPYSIPKIKSYHKRIYNIRRNKGSSVLGFIRIGIVTTPKQVKNIQRNIQDIRGMVGLTCMHAVKRVLDKYTDFSILFPISLFPTISTASLLVAKKTFASRKISRIEPHMFHRPKTHLMADAFFATLLEVMAIVLIVKIFV